jgi:hypothetical protein
MRAHEDRHAAVGHSAEDVFDQAGASRVEANHRFVDDDCVWPMEKCCAHDETLFHAVRKAFDQFVFPSLELEKGKHLADALSNVVSIQAV